MVDENSQAFVGYAKPIIHSEERGEKFQEKKTKKQHDRVKRPKLY